MPSSKSHPQTISIHESYSLREFRLRTGMGDFAFREARKDGLPVRKVGQKIFMLGSDWLEFLQQQPKNLRYAEKSKAADSSGDLS
jgi:hypothetical protein